LKKKFEKNHHKKLLESNHSKYSRNKIHHKPNSMQDINQPINQPVNAAQKIKTGNTEASKGGK